MPGQDRTGPLGQDSLTGRGIGPCGCGQRRRFAQGFSYRATRQVALTEGEQKKILELELKEIELEKQEIEKRLNDIK